MPDDDEAHVTLDMSALLVERLGPVEASKQVEQGVAVTEHDDAALVEVCGGALQGSACVARIDVAWVRVQLNGVELALDVWIGEKRKSKRRSPPPPRFQCILPGLDEQLWSCTLPGPHPKQDLSPGVLKSIERTTGLKLT